MKEKKKKEKRKRKKEKKKVMWYKFRTKINKKIVQIPTKIIFVCAKNSCNNLIILRALQVMISCLIIMFYEYDYGVFKFY